MSEFNNESLPNLELKIEHMLDKLIETDEELEKKSDINIVKINEEITNYEDEKYFEKDFLINQSSQNDEQSKIKESKNKAQLISFQNKIITMKNNIPDINKINFIYNNFPPQACFYSQILSRPSNSNMNSNCTTSYSSNYENNNTYNPNSNSNTSYLFTYKNNINFKDNNSLMNNGFQYFSNSFYAGDKICFNKNNNNSYMFYNNNIFNSNVEIEILLIEVKKILNKLEKIDLTIYNKLKGKFEQIIRTHKGSRIFQNYLKSTHTDILDQIFLELKNKLPELLRDNYSNYFCKKFFNSLSQKDRIEFLTTIQNDLSSLAIDFIATYPIQGIIEQLGSKAEKKIIYMGIKDSINVFCYNVYGTHILEKILSYFEDEFVKEIIDYVYKNFIDLSYHVNGICIVKKLLLMAHKKSLHNNIKKLIYDNAMNLIIHQYGNYVIQTIVENWDDNELEDILNIYKNKYIYLSKQKFSSNAVERILEKNKKNLENFLNEVCNNNNIIEIIKNKYGNYVIQKAVKLSVGLTKERLLDEISKNINKLKDKKIISKWKAIISSKYYL